MGMVVSDTAIDVALTLATPVLTTALGIVGLTVSDWRQKRTQAGRLKHAFEDANRQVAFATEWLKAREAVVTDTATLETARAETLAWLDDAWTKVAQSKAVQAQNKPPVTLRRLFLLFPMQSGLARRLRAGYLFVSSFLPLFILGAVYGWLTHAQHDSSPYVGSSHFYRNVVGLGVVLLLSAGLRSYAIHAETNRPSVHHGGKGLRRALLLYRFHRPAAKVVRILFYLLLAHTFSSVVSTTLMGVGPKEELALHLGLIATYVAWTALLAIWAASLEAAASQAPGTPVLAATESADAVSNTSMTTSVSR
ncbi:hypothetical protein [Mycolicibacterium arseniciresistens]|uniref:DUF4328 domain-containing protein n=1 Tax=Mycolicibacterium arseniciresistens TaxID=3062257 RepID=A0ABT8UJ34_9MYCO|nr:hypothetical protein [Mycolicibacterium arseniciresistens]MDO3637166.1 hypothetical protein [Mycolicibacterium arseniciresistens]